MTESAQRYSTGGTLRVLTEEVPGVKRGMESAANTFGVDIDFTDERVVGTVGFFNKRYMTQLEFDIEGTMESIDGFRTFVQRVMSQVNSPEL